MGRLILVSNRLPVTVRAERGRVRAAPSAGGLATGLRGPHEKSRGRWIGWPGHVEHLGRGKRAALSRQLARLGLVPIRLSRAEVAHYYDGFSNGVLWPLFHYMLDRIPVDARGWETYRRVNARFAQQVVAAYRPGDTIWVHDYQLLLLPALVRAKVPDARIGFFLHTPFPSAEVFAILPWRTEVLRGVLGADLVGFHTVSYMRHFAASLVRTLGIEADVDRIAHDGREVSLGVFPIGIDGPGRRALAADPRVAAEKEALRSRHRGQHLLLGIDRLDYTKGIRGRLLAVDRLLQREPRWRGKVTLLQVAVPSREKVPEYQRLRSEVDELVGRINGAHGTLSWVPIRHLSRSFTDRQVTAMYGAADVMLVTPLRDGMNLVAKEFAASRADEDGVLVLSELAGAASELGDAVQINPYDIDGMAAALDRALRMGREERRQRMRAMRDGVFSHDVHWWAQAFLDALESTPARGPIPARRTAAATIAARVAGATELVLFLDYDGTLVPFARHPRDAAPDDEILELLERLSRRPATAVHLVSGRPKEALDAWFGSLPVGLHGEHGLWSRLAPGEPWTEQATVTTNWKERVRALMSLFVSRTPGSFVEEKTASLAWHFRAADPEFGTLQANRLRLHLGDLFRNAPVRVFPGNRTVEVRHQSIHKGLAVSQVLARSSATAIAMGDDQTDEDLFAALPPDGIAIQVGAGPSRAPFRLPDHRAARRFLRLLLRPRARPVPGGRAATSRTPR